MIIILYIMGGLILLYAGAEALVKGSSVIAFRLGISHLVVGLTIVAFGTSAPELVISLKAAVAGTGDISLGNVIGSNICNIGLILGLSALICPLNIQLQTIRFDVPFMLISSIIFIFFSLGLRLDRIEGIVLFVGFIFFIVFNIVSINREKKKGVIKKSENNPPAPYSGLWKYFLQIGIGLVFLNFGSNFLIKGSVKAADLLGVSEAFIGLTIIALGTSLPELATSIMASWKGEKDIAVGNIIGSNIFNILCVLGLSSIICPIQGVNIQILDLLFMLGLSVLIFPLMKTDFTLKRWEGGLMMGLYFLYIYLLLSI
ncbi:MAG: calcium/sodium antiporter [bacterium]